MDSANEERVGQEAVLSPDLVHLVAEVGVEHGTVDTRNDAEFWRKVGEVGRAIWQAYQSRDRDGAGLVAGIPIVYRGTSDGISVPIDTVPDVSSMTRANPVDLGSGNTRSDQGGSAGRFDDRLCLNQNCTSSVIR